jgi:tRNA G10  N-methylase Trm11
MVECENNDSLISILDQTAGVIKAFQVITEAPQEDSFTEEITSDLVEKKATDFSVFFHPYKDALSFMKVIKNGLKEHALSGRFVTSKSGGLSASVLIHQSVKEYGILKLAQTVYLTRTCWAQDIDHWSIKDVEKPHRDPERGMLPPKLARMMINFLSPELKTQTNKRLYDPFCGTGTLLIEAAELGWSVIGSDISQTAINQSGENLHWFSQYRGISPDITLFIADASQVTSEQIKGRVQAIVTEPFLGKQQPRPDQLPNIFKGLEKMYWGILKRWTQILEDGGEVVLITPLVQQSKQNYSLEKIIDKSRELGYSILSGPMMYSREHTIVQRAIYHLKYEK